MSPTVQGYYPASARHNVGLPSNADWGGFGHGHIRPGSVTTEKSEESVGLLAVQGTSQGLKSGLDRGATVFIDRDHRLDQLFEGRAGEARRLHDSGGDSLEPILAEFQIFTAIGGSATFAGSAHGEGLR